MKIVAPISRVEEVVPLLEAGADEIYCGIVPADWTERFRNAAVNRRAFGNLTAYDDLARVVGLAAERKRPVSLVMNAQHYAEAYFDPMVELAHRFADMGGSSLIVGDLALLAELAERGPPLRLHASSLIVCRNAELAGLCGDLGAKRVVLPRDMTVAEIGAVTAACPGMEFEAFVLNDGCVFDEGCCHTIHLPSKLGGPICLDNYHADYARIDGRPLSAAEQQRLDANDEAYARWLWYRFSCGFSVTAEGYPYGPCGLCTIPELAAAGVGAVKIAGREGATARKVKSVEMVRSALDHYRQPGGATTLPGFARAIRGESCDSGYMCYYVESRPGRDGLEEAVHSSSPAGRGVCSRNG